MGRVIETRVQAACLLTKFFMPLSKPEISQTYFFFKTYIFLLIFYANNFVKLHRFRVLPDPSLIWHDNDSMSNGIIWSLSSGRSNYFSIIISTYLRRLNSNFDSVICCSSLSHRCQWHHYPIGHGIPHIENNADDKTTSNFQWS